MKVICSWCQRVLTPGPPAPVSHGVCPVCLAVMMRQLDASDAQAAATVLKVR
ncbi:MAG: hypothetical protein ABI665_28090 [Vicinamibacterales bacterium]